LLLLFTIGIAARGVNRCETQLQALAWMRSTQRLEKDAAEGMRVNRIRGMVMLLAGAAAIWKGWQIHRGELAVLAYGLGALALALGVWHLTRKEPKSRPRR
jgi:hypothetical protein